MKHIKINISEWSSLSTRRERDFQNELWQLAKIIFILLVIGGMNTDLEYLCLFKLRDGCSPNVARECFYSVTIQRLKVWSFSPALILHQFMQTEQASHSGSLWTAGRTGEPSSEGELELQQNAWLRAHCPVRKGVNTVISRL